MRKRLLGLSPIALGLGLLGACSPLATDYTPSEVGKQSHIDFVRVVQPLSFPSGKDRLSTAEQRTLADFLSRRPLGYGDRISIVARRSDKAGEAALIKRRVTHLNDMLAPMRLSGADVQVTTDGDIAADQVVVVVGRYLVTPPACPNWNKPAGYDFTNTPEPNLGCANAYNFALMVADPGDIIEGRSLGPADGEQQTRSIQTYRGMKDDRYSTLRPSVSLPQPYYPIEPRLPPRQEVSTSGVSTGGSK